ncbi:hypothetical protein PPYR_14663 [Photinus pyralis]|uniref:Inositol polyphosphate-related phosphatase domain-containing protein n=2 Tax=Photinus pyralis TaxID=7054 RepID=A0A1Y1M7I0_PHOPY|nr:phosphatidylinositol 4,5-bisphosphate 5-phosphatase A-like isoform X1 [Photinus pyralis]KAB0792704.1 hypothetical protein PPYR_14663 [Photinus pyralis]
MDNLKLYMVTYNVGTTSPDQDLHDLLSLNPNAKNEKSLPDFYVVSLQEVKSKPANMLMDSLFNDSWTNSTCNILAARDYVKLKTIRLQGLVLSVYSLRKHLFNVREIESEYTRTGLSGMWGNKGAVSVRLGAYGCSLCFVNSHLAAHDEGLDDRVEDYNAIIKDQEFHVPEHTEIFFHDYVFWMGDLNFRLMEQYEMAPDEIERLIKKGELEKLFAYDQLRHVMSTGKAFSELTEADPKFAPTFKFGVGSDDYDHKRRPAWTDRILYKVNSNNYENVTLKLEQKSYVCHGQYTVSDHRPVSAEFVIKIPDLNVRVDAQVFSENLDESVQFEKIPVWYLDEENIATYKFTKDTLKNKDDWIGVFRENFNALDDYVVYEYVNKSSSPLPASKSPHRGTHHEGLRYTLTFPELPLGRSCSAVQLIYFSLTEDNVQTVLGISDPIPLKKKD